MKRINMTKYGFVRWPEKDFTDDGSSFICYRAGKAVRVSKHVSDGLVYLSADPSSCAGGTLPYEIYSKFPHYSSSAWKYNGFSIEHLTEQDLIDFYNDCVEYEKEYEAAEASIKYPTLEEIKDKAVKVTAKSIIEMNKVEILLKNFGAEAAVKFSEHEWGRLQEYLKRLAAEVKRFDPETYPQTVVGKAYSFDFIKPDRYMEESYWFKSIKELFEQHCF